MIKTSTGSVCRGVVTFFCPACDHVDSSYAGMPKECFYCGGKYNFNIDKLAEELYERKSFHLNFRGMVDDASFGKNK